MATSASISQDRRPSGRASGVPARGFLRRALSGDRIAYGIVFSSASAIVALTVLLVYELWLHSALARHKFGWGFLFTQTWDPIAGHFGALPFIYGTVVTSALALVFAIPLGVGAAIFLAELAPPRVSDALTFLIELLAAVPSVIIGLVGIFVLVPVLQEAVPVLKSVLGFLPIFSGAFYGVSIFTAGVLLSVMIVPFIISISREVLLAVPRDLREAALALGATRWESTWQVVIPCARSGIVGSIFLALARTLGETMAVTMVIGNSPKISASLLAPGYSIAAVIANEFAEAAGDLYLSSLIELGLVLFALTIIINGAARLLILTTTAKGAR
ncbi:MAG: phosphate ABC transporter permease subunit PstC [Acidobacteriia bacterium]|nr:phosphate ABC transporter permease subunit PstC [Terriglobia bacterium]